MSNTDSLLLTYLFTGLAIGFGHCIGMCGPLVISLSLNLKGQKTTLSHLLYHCGRILTYGILGAIMGATGSFTIVAANMRALQIGALFLAGMLVIIMGLAMGGWIPHAAIFDAGYSPGGLMTRWFARLSRSRSGWLHLPAGLVLGLLPCGPVYTALLGAAGAGMESPGIARGMLTGMTLMWAFGLGTVPALFLVGRLADAGWLKFRHKIYKLGSLMMVGLGVYFIVSAIRY